MAKSQLSSLPLKRDMSVLQSISELDQDVTKTGLNDQSFVSRNPESIQNREIKNKVD
jgi:hypothetical protein